MELQNKVALITGARRIGATLAVDLARQGVDVGLSYHQSVDIIEAAAVRVRETGRRALVTKADISQPAEVQQLVSETVEVFGRVDILVNMASIYRHRPFDALTADDWNAPLSGASAVGILSVSLTGRRRAVGPDTGATFRIMLLSAR